MSGGWGDEIILLKNPIWQGFDCVDLLGCCCYNNERESYITKDSIAKIIPT